jgi:hypothetical protein
VRKRNLLYDHLGRTVREDSLRWSLFEFAVLGIEPRAFSVLVQYCTIWDTVMVGLLSVYLGIAWVSVPISKFYKE